MNRIIDLKTLSSRTHICALAVFCLFGFPIALLQTFLGHQFEIINTIQMIGFFCVLVFLCPVSFKRELKWIRADFFEIIPIGFVALCFLRTGDVVVFEFLIFFILCIFARYLNFSDKKFAEDCQYLFYLINLCIFAWIISDQIIAKLFETFTSLTYIGGRAGTYLVFVCLLGSFSTPNRVSVSSIIKYDILACIVLGLVEHTSGLGLFLVCRFFSFYYSKSILHHQRKFTVLFTVISLIVLSLVLTRVHITAVVRFQELVYLLSLVGELRWSGDYNGMLTGPLFLTGYIFHFLVYGGVFGISAFLAIGIWSCVSYGLVRGLALFSGILGFGVANIFPPFILLWILINDREKSL
jgi:hypothetical protein